MAKKEVIVTITKDGIATDFSGFRNGKCFDAAEEIRKRLLALGVDVTPVSAEPNDEPPPDEEATQLNHRERQKN